VSYQVEISALGLSIVQKSNTNRGVPECDRETSITLVNTQNVPITKIVDSYSI